MTSDKKSLPPESPAHKVLKAMLLQARVLRRGDDLAVAEIARQHEARYLEELTALEKAEAATPKQETLAIA